MTAAELMEMARESGFELVGIASARDVPESEHYLDWVSRGLAGEMKYLTDERAQKRKDVRSLMPSAKSVLVVGKLYNTAEPYSMAVNLEGRGWISRYAWTGDYHLTMKRSLTALAETVSASTGCDYKVCVDTAPLLERSLAKQAGLGWIGKNTCLINQGQGSWFFLGEILLSLELETGLAPPDRCGTCTRCVDACPTKAIVPVGKPGADRYELDSRLCISYFTIELRGPIPEQMRPEIGQHLFGCDICQDVCPWNRKAPVTADPDFQPKHVAPDLAGMAALSPEDFTQTFRDTPVERTRHRGFLRNVAVAMGNSGNKEFAAPLRLLAAHQDEVVREHAEWGLKRLA